MNHKGLIRFSVAALVLICIGVSGCSEGSDRIYSPQIDESNDQLSTGLNQDYFTDGTPGDSEGYPIFDDGTNNDPTGLDDGWLDKYADDGGDTPGGGGGSTKPLDFESRED